MIDLDELKETIGLIVNRRLNLLNGDYFDLEAETNGFTRELVDTVINLQHPSGYGIKDKGSDYPVKPAIFDEEMTEAAFKYINSDRVNGESMQTAFGDFVEGARWKERQMYDRAEKFLSERFNGEITLMDTVAFDEGFSIGKELGSEIAKDANNKRSKL